jgi:hypothetical protein
MQPKKVRKKSELELALIRQLRLETDLPAFTDEYNFSSVKGWRFDLAYPDYKVAVECEGEGRHKRWGGFLEDMNKYFHAQLDGWLLIRVASEIINDGVAVEWIRAGLKARGCGFDAAKDTEGVIRPDAQFKRLYTIPQASTEVQD